jgi:hypothetical protein
MSDIKTTLSIFATRRSTSLDDELLRTKPSKLPPAGSDMIQNLARGRMRSIPIIFTDTTGSLRIATEFRTVCDDNFASCTMGVIFNPDDNTHQIKIINPAPTVEEITWKGPNIAKIVEDGQAESIDEMIKKSEEDTHHCVTYAYIPADIINTINNWQERSATEFLAAILKQFRLCFKTHCKNGNVRKTLPTNIIPLITFLSQHIRFAGKRNQVELKPTDDKMKVYILRRQGQALQEG